MPRKLVRDLKEKIKTVKLHFYRLGKLLRYFIEHNATIEIINSKGNKIIYTGKSRDGNPSIAALAVDVLGISDVTAREYISRKLGIDDRHSQVDKIYEEGKIIETISPYFKSDSPEDQAVSHLSRYRYLINDGYRGIPNEQYLEEFFKNDIESIPGRAKGFLGEKIKNFDSLLNIAVEPNYAFNNYNRKLASYIIEIKNDQPRHYQDLRQFLKKMYKRYTIKLKSQKRENIILGYQDFSITHNAEIVKDSLSSNQKIIKEVQSSDSYLPLLDTIIEYRYELIWYHKLNRSSIDELPTHTLGLLYLVNMEYIAAEQAILDGVEDALQDMRFTIYGSDKLAQPTVQMHSYTLWEISQLLEMYMLPDNFKDLISGDSVKLIKERIFKFPEPHAAVTRYKAEYIEELLNMAYAKVFFKKIVSDLYFCNTELPLDEIFY